MKWMTCVTLFVLFSAGCDDVDTSNQKPAASLEGRTVTISPYGATFEVPQTWVNWHSRFKNNIHLSREELDAVRTADGEWDTEYAQVVNAMLPFDACILHAGGSGWGREGTSYVDVQMRVYLVGMTPDQVVERVVTAGDKEASKIAKTTVQRRADFDGWQRATLSYPLKYEDYGGTAGIDVFAKSLDNRTAVLVFMYLADSEPGQKEVEGIVQSFQPKK